MVRHFPLLQIPVTRQHLRNDTRCKQTEKTISDLRRVPCIPSPQNLVNFGPQTANTNRMHGARRPGEAIATAPRMQLASQ